MGSLGYRNLREWNLYNNPRTVEQGGIKARGAGLVQVGTDKCCGLQPVEAYTLMNFLRHLLLL